MKCPVCGKDTMYPVYRRKQPTYILDGDAPLGDVIVLAGLNCDVCADCWYTFPGETVETAYKRICKEEPRP